MTWGDFDYDSMHMRLMKERDEALLRAENAEKKLAELADKLESELLDETTSSTTKARDPIAQISDIARDLGYRGGWNDRARSMAKYLRGERDK